jgi:hypothetical protein
MSTPDSLLIVWWFFTAILTVAAFALVKRFHALNPQATLWPPLRADGMREHTRPLSTPALRSLVFMAIALILVWVAGLFAVTWMCDWTSLYRLNWDLLSVLFGAGILAHGIWPNVLDVTSNPLTRWSRVVARPLAILFGLIVLSFSSYWLVGDFVFPRLIMEGRVDSVSHSSARWDRFTIVINGERHNTLRDVYLAVGTGDRVRAELGAGSKYVLRIERLPLARSTR